MVLCVFFYVCRHFGCIHTISLRYSRLNLEFSENCFLQKSFRAPSFCITELMAFDVTTIHKNINTTETTTIYTHSPKADIDNFNFNNYYNAFFAYVDTFNLTLRTTNYQHVSRNKTKR